MRAVYRPFLMAIKPLSATVLLCLLSLSARAFAEPGFYAPTELSKANTPQGLKRAVQASMIIRSALDDSACSAFMVSQSGHALTALHCVDDFLRVAGKEVLFSRDFSFYQGAGYVPLKAGETISADIRPFGLVLDVSIIHYGLAWVSGFRFSPLKEKTQEELKVIFENQISVNEDFAVLKFTPKEGSKTPCVPVLAQVPAVGSRVWGVGYPGKNDREGGHGSDGADVKVTFGKVVGDLEKNPVLTFLTPSLRGQYFETMKRSKVFVSDMDLFHRSSGGLVMNKVGKAIGMTVALIDSTDDDSEWAKTSYLPDNAFILSTEKIVESTRSHFGAAAASAIFNCPSSPANSPVSSK